MKKQEQKNKTVFHAVAALLAVLAVVLVLYGGGRWLEKRAEKPETRTQLPQADQETVEVDGVTYRKKSRLTTILVMGVDHDTQDSYEYRKAGQADFLRLVVLDDADKTVQQLQIDRDTITPVTVLGLLGDRYEPVTQQICLGYAFGDGRQTSCEVTVEAVENLLGGQEIDQYLAMGLDGISTLNDLAGGVTVTLEDDFSAIDPAMTKGTTLTLQGEQAETYVRSRRSIGVGTNEARMARQESYIRQLSVQLDEKLQKDQNFAVDAYDALQPYLAQKEITIVIVVTIPKISGAKIRERIAVVIGVINRPIISPNVDHFKDFFDFFFYFYCIVIHIFKLLLYKTFRHINLF